MYKLADPKKPFDLLQVEERMADFEEKNRILDKIYPEIKQYDFYKSLFHSSDIEAWVLDAEETSGAKVKKVCLKDLPELNNKSSVYVYPADFHEWVKDRLIDELYAFVLDMDKMRPADLERLLVQMIDINFPMPTMIVNSGSGVHFYYITREAIQFYDFNNTIKQACIEIYDILHRKIKDLYTNVQQHHIAQSYRLVGSKTKYGQTASAFVSGYYYYFDELCRICDIKLADITNPQKVPATARQTSYARAIASYLDIEPPADSMEDTQNFIEQYEKDFKERKKADNKPYESKKPRSRGGFYQDTRWKIRRGTEPGHRYDSLRALAIIAVKTGVSYEQFEKDVLDISDFWRYGGVYTRDPWTQEHVPAVLRSYKWAETHGKKVRSEVLEDMLGWKFRRKGVKRNYRKQEVHMKIASSTRDILYPNGEWRNKDGRPTKQKLVEEYFKEHPDSTVRQAAADLKISKTTVQKWKKGIEKSNG